MKVIDLSHPMSPDMPVYPGAPSPSFQNTATIENIGFCEMKMSFFSHTGTHMDAPAHMIPEGRTLDRFPAGHFFGPGLVLGVSGFAGRRIPVSFLAGHEDRIGDVDFLLLRSDWSRYWGDAQYYEGYPVLSPDAARFLRGFRLKGVGVDMISADPPGLDDLQVHNILLGRDILIIENLTDLDLVPDGRFLFSCLPINIANADGGPVRAAAIVGE